jgi:hypothetical protein
MNTGNERSPASDHSHRKNHAWENTAVHSHEIWKFGMFFEISWSNLFHFISIFSSLGAIGTYKILIQIWHNPAIPISVLSPKCHGRLRAARDLEIESRFRERGFARCVVHWRDNLVGGIVVASREVGIATARLGCGSFVRHDELSVRVCAGYLNDSSKERKIDKNKT